MTFLSHDLRRASEVTWALMLPGFQGRQTRPISPTLVVPAISVKEHFCVNASRDIYSLKITASSTLALSHSFFVSTHLCTISRLEKCIHTNQPLKISRAEYEVFLFILVVVAYSQS